MWGSDDHVLYTVSRYVARSAVVNGGGNASGKYPMDNKVFKRSDFRIGWSSGRVSSLIGAPSGCPRKRTEARRMGGLRNLCVESFYQTAQALSLDSVRVVGLRKGAVR